MNITLRSGEFYGETQTHRTLPDFRLIVASYSSGVRLPKHSHQCACFSLMLDGAMTESYGHRTLESHKLTVGFNAANEQHSNKVSLQGARFLILEIGPDQTRRAQRYSPQFSKSAVFNGGDLSSLGLKLFREYAHYDDLSPLVIEGLALEMIGTVCRMNAESLRIQSPRWLSQARELIHNQFSGQLSVSLIAKAVGVHSVHLSRTFARYFGASIGDYVRSLRVERARHEISSTNLSLAEIAANTGFYDQSHLSRVFKRELGLTPGQYRKLFRTIKTSG